MVDMGLLKRHKTLPHPRTKIEHNLNDIDFYLVTSGTTPRRINTSVSTTSSNSQASSPRALKHASRRLGGLDLPPTPPNHSRQSSAGSSTGRMMPVDEDKRASAQIAIPRTPPQQASPPTPEFTPPRPTQQTSLTLRPPLAARYPSSRTASFKTAPEYQESDDEVTVRPVLSSSRASETTLRSSNITGLGLGIESESPSIGFVKDATLDARDGFSHFDGEWYPSGFQAGVSEVVKEWDDNLMRNVTVRRRHHPQMIDSLADFSSGMRAESEVVDDNQTTPSNATKFLQQSAMLQPHKSNTESPTSDPSPSARWTRLMTSDPSADQGIRRQSAMWAKPAYPGVVEAFVVETAPQGVRTLRHTKKYSGLRQMSSGSSTESPAASVSSREPSHRLSHAAKSRDLRNVSLGSGITSNTTSTTSSSGQSRKEILKSGAIPVVIVPERRSSSMNTAKTPSLRSTSSKRTPYERSASLCSAPASGSSRTHGTSYSDLPRKGSRRASESASSTSQRTIDYPPTVPVRSSSLSAPTSRVGSVSGSRTGSLTAESLKKHNLQEAANSKSQPVDANDALGSAASVSRRDDPRKLSAHATPFSTHSYETSGTIAEVSEARRVSLFPHQNSSVLMVQNAAEPSEQSVTARERVVDEASTAENIPRTPSPLECDMDKDDSPFRNPRDPPLPPAIIFIPATPGLLSPPAEVSRQLEIMPEPPVFELRPKRGFSLRRALTTRRHSESTASRALSLRRSNSTTSATLKDRPSVPNRRYSTLDGQPAEVSRLHPFWRPARFWDDLEDEYSDDDDGTSGDGSRAVYSHDAHKIRHMPQPPKRTLSGRLARTFAVLPIKDDPYYAPEWTERRILHRTESGNLRVVKKRVSLEALKRDRQSWDDSSKRKKMGVSEAWKGLSRRLSEKRREKRQDELRSRISGPKDFVHGSERLGEDFGDVRQERKDGPFARTTNHGSNVNDGRRDAFGARRHDLSQSEDGQTL